jgi:flavin-dependent dehydrogenase
MSAAFDVAIVGARCAGASLAAHLGRAGLSVVVLDAGALPGDQPLSTHLIQPPGMDELDLLGIGDPVRAASPAIEAGRLSFDGREVLMRYGEGRAAHCLRRSQLDAMLQDAACAAGADLQGESRVVALERHANGRVNGVRVRRRSGREESISARFVVGADGRSSTVARLAGAEEYLGYDGARATSWAYWRRNPDWNPALLLNLSDDEHSRVMFPTGDDQVLIATAPPVSHAKQWVHNHDDWYLDNVRSCPRLADTYTGDGPVGRVRVLAKTRYFFRKAVGPGWALAGDAGHHKEFVIGFGITDALRDARTLAAAIVDGSDRAFERYWRERDLARIEMFRWGEDLGRPDRVNALERLVAESASSTPGLESRFGSVVDGRISPYDMFPARNVAAWVAGAAMRGNLEAAVWAIAMVKRRIVVGWERERRRRIAEAVRPRSLKSEVFVPSMHRQAISRL